MTGKIKIQKNSVQETLMMPLYARKVCTELFPSIFQDEKSVELVNKLDYDFSTLDKKMRTTLGKFGALETAMRQYDLAIEVKSYLSKHPYASIINLGCGLDQTGENCDNGICKIYNLDFADVIDLRNEVIPLSDKGKNIAVNLNDISWFDEIDSENGAIFMAAGLFYYFQKTDVNKLFCAMQDRFKGCVLVFDSAGKKAVKLIVKSWVREANIRDVNAYFYVNNIHEDLTVWLSKSKVSAKPYMLGYHDLRDKSISGLNRFLAKIGDKNMKMKIVKIEF